MKEYVFLILINALCDGDKAQTNWSTQGLRNVWTVGAMRHFADQFSAAGYEW